MAIDLSTLIFTNKADIVPPLGIEEITNAGIANTIGGNDKITGTTTVTGDGIYNGIENRGTINTDVGNDKITGIGTTPNTVPITNAIDLIGINNYGGTINIGTGDDEITGIATNAYSNIGIFNTANGVIDGGNGDDKITGISINESEGGNGAVGIYLNAGGIIDGSNGDDWIIGTGVGTNGNSGRGIQIFNFPGISAIRGGNGDDHIIGTGTGNGALGIYNQGIIDGRSGDDWIIGSGIDTFTGNGFTVGIFNNGTIDTGSGNDIIIGTSTLNNTISSTDNSYGIYNATNATIDTGTGNDILTGIGSTYGIYNDSTIDTGDGDDIIDARSGGFRGLGKTLLGIGNDILKGFGSGNFYGGRGKDTLELPSGSYTVGMSGTVVSFMSNGLTMNTSEFEKLIAGGTRYDFTGLSNGQTITIA
jgi:hypothetical protein